MLVPGGMLSASRFHGDAEEQGLRLLVGRGERRCSAAYTELCIFPLGKCCNDFASLTARLGRICTDLDGGVGGVSTRALKLLAPWVTSKSMRISADFVRADFEACASEDGGLCASPMVFCEVIRKPGKVCR
jgi:hypothetical protein